MSPDLAQSLWWALILPLFIYHAASPYPRRHFQKSRVQSSFLGSIFQSVKVCASWVKSEDTDRYSMGFVRTKSTNLCYLDWSNFCTTCSLSRKLEIYGREIQLILEDIFQAVAILGLDWFQPVPCLSSYLWVLCFKLVKVNPWALQVLNGTFATIRFILA